VILQLTSIQGLAAEDVGSSSLFSGEEELFAFARCVSRLSQMGYVVFRLNPEGISR
jgi:predicted ATPase